MLTVACDRYWPDANLESSFGQLLRDHLGQDARSASPDGSFAIARTTIAVGVAKSNDHFVAATLADLRGRRRRVSKREP
jgi:hypothetical protein